jgi:hypothetical protein
MSMKKISITAALVALLLSGCGGSNTIPAATLTVTPALGAVFGATVNVIDQNGHVVMTGTTGSTGTAVMESVVPITGPVIIKVVLPAGASYFDEKSGAIKQISTPTNLYSLATSVGANSSAGVTALTNMAAKLAGVSDATTSAANLTPTAIATAVAKVNLAVGLPATYNILQAPAAVATSSSNIPTTGYSGLLAQIALAATTDALAQATTLSVSVSTDGTIANFSSLSTVINTVATKATTTIQQAPQTPITDNTSLTNTAAADASSVLSNISGSNATGSTGSTGSTGATGSLN